MIVVPIRSISLAKFDDYFSKFGNNTFIAKFDNLQRYYSIRKDLKHLKC